jgi:WhiB family transcriptional regulator, redox-sensing transcriptional regulator
VTSPWNVGTFGNGALDWSVRHLDWHDSALCREIGGDLFHPDHGEHSITRMAKAICNGTEKTEPCPVRESCLLWALEVGDNHAVLGGMSPRQRHRLQAERRRTHGNTCAICSKAFFDGTPTQAYCSTDCQREARKRQDRRRTA